MMKTEETSSTALVVLNAFVAALNKLPRLQQYFGVFLNQLARFIIQSLKNNAHLSLNISKLSDYLLLALPQPFSNFFHTQLQSNAAYFIASRKAMVHAQIQHSLSKAEITQVVFLGGGLDPQSLNTAYTYPNVRVFELDKGPTMTFKTEALIAFCQAHPEYILTVNQQQSVTTLGQCAHFIECDFAADDVKQTLTMNGFDPDIPTLFIAEGLTPYLPENDLKRFFETITNMMNAQSQFLTSFVSQSPGFMMRNLLDASHETYHFTLATNQVQDFVRQFGLAVRHQYTPERTFDLLEKPTLKEKYLKKTGGKFSEAYYLLVKEKGEEDAHDRIPTMQLKEFKLPKLM